MNKSIRRFLQDESGVSTVECGLVFVGILLAVAMIVRNFGDQQHVSFLRR